MSYSHCTAQSEHLVWVVYSAQQMYSLTRFFHEEAQHNLTCNY